MGVGVADAGFTMSGPARMANAQTALQRQFIHQCLQAGQFAGVAPDLDAATVRRLKSVIHWELVLIGGILLCASLMARGFGA